MDYETSDFVDLTLGSTVSKTLQVCINIDVYGIHKPQAIHEYAAIIGK